MRNLTWKVAIWPDRAQYRPGERLGLIAEVSGPPGHSADLQVTVTEGAAVAAHLRRAVQLGA